MKTLSVTLLAFLVLVSAGSAAPKTSSSYSKQIIGRWLGSTKFEIYYPDGHWAVQRSEGSEPDKTGRTWHIDGDKLILTYPGGTTTETIVSMSHSKFVTKDEGHEDVRTRSGR